jgi:hypothetical protein
MGAALVALAALEIAIGGRSAALTRLGPVGIHRKAHRATRFAPVEAGRDEDLVQAFGLGLLLDQPGSGDDRRTDVGVDRPSLSHARDFAQILDTCVGTGADEDAVERRKRIRIKPDLAVEFGRSVGVQRFPIAHGRVPHLALGGFRSAFQILKGFVVRRDDAGPRAGLDGHVADGDAAFHRKRTDRVAGNFHRVTDAAGAWSRQILS